MKRRRTMLKRVAVAGLGISMLDEPSASAAQSDQSRDSSGPSFGFDRRYIDHGVATPYSNHRGIVATADADGRNIVLAWLYDHRGGYALLLVDADTGVSKEIQIPFASGGDSPFSSLLSGANRFYTHFNSQFVEFDPLKGAFTFLRSTAPQMAMSMTEDDQGRIWFVTYPNSGLACFDPKSRELRDYGSIHRENWPQYQRSIASDDSGWIYFAVGNTASQIIAFDAQRGAVTAMLPESERSPGTAFVYRDVNGKVYGQALRGRNDAWYEFHRGRATRLGGLERRNPKAIITADQNLFHDHFPDGRRLTRFDLVERVLEVRDPTTGRTQQRPFNYTSSGAKIMTVAVSPDGTICGGTSFPMRFFSFNPSNEVWINRESHGQWNTLGQQGARLFVGGYPGGFLLEWDPSQPWRRTERGSLATNPKLLGQWEPDIDRPHKLLSHPDGETIVLAGTPGYGITGGGLLFWNRRTQIKKVIAHTQILPYHSTMSMVALPGGKVLGGTTTNPGTGGERKVRVAEMYVMDMTTYRVEWHAAPFSDIQSYDDLCLGPSGVVYGVDSVRFFVFEIASRRLLHYERTDSRFGSVVHQQGPRRFVVTREGRIYLLFRDAIAQVDTNAQRLMLVTRPPVPITSGGDSLYGRIYFGSNSRLLSYRYDRA